MDVNHFNRRRKVLIRWSAIVISIGLLLSLLAILRTSAGAESALLQFTVLHTNDEHSALVPYLDPDDPEKEIGGLARLATAIAAVREEKAAAGEPVLLFSGGDFLGETAYGWLSTWGFAPEIEILQMMGYDAITIGNHEYDFGPEILADYLLLAGYPQAHDQTLLLASNTMPPAHYKLAQEELFRESGLLILDNGLKIGVFGLIGEDAVSVISDSGEIEFLDQHETARNIVEKLRSEGAEIIIALTHSGEDEDVLLARDVEGIDLIIGGHAHTLLAEPIVEQQTLIIQAGSQTAYLGQIELSFDRSTGQLSARNDQTGRPFIERIDDRFDPHPDIQERVDFYTQTINELMGTMTGGRFTDIHQNLARADFSLTNRPRLQESLVGNFIADGMRLMTQEVTGRRVDVALQANGSIRGSLVPRGPAGAPGMLTFYDITNTIGLGFGQDGYPGYSIASIYLTGEELRRVLEIAALLPELMGDQYFLQFSGLRYNYNPANTILLTIPVMNQPIPSTRSIIEADLYRGEGIQQPDSSDYHPLRRGDETLYHLVTDTYILSFLPVAGDILPQLEVVPKNEQGEPVPFERFHELTVSFEGRELKVWETVAMYAASLPAADDGIAVIPASYASLDQRINPVRGFPLIGWLIIFLVLLLAGLVLLIRLAVVRRRRRKAAKLQDQPV